MGLVSFFRRLFTGEPADAPNINSFNLNTVPNTSSGLRKSKHGSDEVDKATARDAKISRVLQILRKNQEIKNKQIPPSKEAQVKKEEEDKKLVDPTVVSANEPKLTDTKDQVTETSPVE